MKVLFLTSWYPTSERIYAGVFVREHARAIRAAGHDVVVIHLMENARGARGRWRMEEEADPELAQGIPTFRVQTVRIPLPGLSCPLNVYGAMRAYRRVRAGGFEPDVIHAHVFDAGVAAVLAGRLFGPKVVVTEHWTCFSEGTLGRVGRWKARFAFGRAAAVLPVSAYLRDAIASYGIRADFRVVGNAVDPRLFYPARRRRRPGRKRIVFVGSLDNTPHKGFPDLLDALDILNGRRGDWQLDVVGEGPARGDHESRVASSSLAAHVAFHGPLTKREVGDMMRASDMLVLPSRFENLPCVIIEAMACGLPVVATRVGGIPELVSELEGVLVPPGDVPALVDALDSVLSGSEAFDRERIASSALARFGLDAVGAQLTEVYESVCRPAQARSQVGPSSGRRPGC
jgi:glycosyltransferase involved in cell wall biosynthesis